MLKDVIQDINEILELASMATPLWRFAIYLALVWSLLIVAALIFLGLRIARRCVVGERENWREILHSTLVEVLSSLPARGIALVAIILVVAFLSDFTYERIGSSSAGGNCSKDGKRHTDEEFIKVALRGNIGLLTFPKKVSDPYVVDQIISDFLAKNPDCCKVFREPDAELGEVTRSIWRDSIVVRIRNEKSLNALRRGEKVVVDEGLYYATVDNCLQGNHVINELVPGG